MSNLVNKQYQFVIFDWDGTLMDSTGRIISCMQTTAKILGYEPPTAQQVKATIGLSMDAVINQIFPQATSQQMQQVKSIYRSQYVDEDATPSPLFPETLELLNWLQNKNITLAVATGKARAGLTRALHTVGLENYFEHSICADEAASKPHPDMVHRLLDSTSSLAEHTIVIGDSIHDLGMANNAGVDCIGITTGACTFEQLQALNPVRVVDQLEELKQVLK